MSEQLFPFTFTRGAHRLKLGADVLRGLTAGLGISRAKGEIGEVLADVIGEFIFTAQ